MSLPAPTFLNLAHRHALEWVKPEEAAALNAQLVGALDTCRVAAAGEDFDDWAEIGFAPPAWWH